MIGVCLCARCACCPYVAVRVCASNTIEDMEANEAAIVEWIAQWKEARKEA